MTNPSLLLLDEVSLGLAPVVVEARLRVARDADRARDDDRARRAGPRRARSPSPTRVVCMLEGRARARGRRRATHARAGDRGVLRARPRGGGGRMNWVNAVVQGILLGGVYALLATGLSLMFGVMRIINLAHGSLALLGAYLAFARVEHTGVSAYARARRRAAGGAACSATRCSVTMLERSLRAGELVPLLTTFGLLDRDREPAAVLLLARRALAAVGRDRLGELAHLEHDRDPVVRRADPRRRHRRARRAAAPAHAHPARPRAACDGGGRRHRRAGRRQRARRLRAGDRDRGRDRGARRRVLRDALGLRPVRRPVAADLRVRGSGDRRRRLAVGHAASAASSSASRRRSARRSTCSTSRWPATSSSSRCSSCARSPPAASAGSPSRGR